MARAPAHAGLVYSLFNLVRKTITVLMSDYSKGFKYPLLQEAFNFILYEKTPQIPRIALLFSARRPCHALRWRTRRRFIGIGKIHRAAL